ncbi:MAG: PTS transporter subunit EIIB [Mycoplasmataceae bacterium]|nr:PTS transporter subunit EIIB [Mycoplasmataceae bacterium]
MKKFAYYLSYIFSFGLVYFYYRSKAKSNVLTYKNKLTVSEKIDFDLNDLVNAVGGKENIVSINAELSTLKFVLKKASEISKEDFNMINVYGFIKNNNNLTLVTGDNAQAIAQAINENILKNN